MNSIDIDREKIKAQFGGRSEKMFEHYREEWANVLLKSSQETKPGQG